MPDGAAPANPASVPATPTEIIHVTERVVACDGGDGGLGHPRVWLRLRTTEALCPYCSRLYVLTGDGADGHH